MKILHVVPGLNEVGNGMAVVARLLAEEQRQAGHEVEVIETRQFLAAPSSLIASCGEVWVHSMWLPMTMKACWKVIRGQSLVVSRQSVVASRQGAGVRLVRMTHGCLSPIYLEQQGKWKKRLAAVFERWLFSKASRVVVTCEAEREWCEQWGVKGPFEITDLKRFFKGTVDSRQSPVVSDGRPLHVLYLGRRHPLKGVQYLERAVTELTQSFDHSEHSNIRPIDLRIVSNHFGEELEKDWEWCDVLCLPTLSENFGLVVAEALERGKRVITTDGAPAWEPGKSLVVSRQSLGGSCQSLVDSRQSIEVREDRLIYLRGFRNGTDEARVKSLVDALGLVASC